MREWLKKYDIWLRALSVFIAVVLWLIVLNIDNPERTVEKRGIDVALIGTNELALEYELGIADSEIPDVSVKLRGTLSRLANVTQDNITVRADVSSITKPGEYYLPYDISVIDGVSIAGRNPDKITVTVEEIVTKVLPVKVEISGGMPSNMETDTPIVSPQNIRVTGVKSELENAKFALVKIEARDITKSINDSFTYTVVNTSGKELKGSSIKQIDRVVDVSVPVYLTREVDLAVDIIEGGGVTAADANVTISPAKIQIRGRSEAVAPMKRIVIGTVDLNSFLKTMSSTMAVTLPEGVISTKAVTEANVTVSVEGIGSALISVDKFNVINVPRGYDAVVETSSVTVTLRGDSEKLKLVDTDKISLTVDFENNKPKLGRDIYLATVDLGDDIDGVGVYGTYNVIVNSSR